MKKISLTILLLSGFVLTAAAQLPNLNKMKDKAKTTLNNTLKDKKEEVSNPGTTTNNTTTSNSAAKPSGNADGRPEYDTESPIYRAYSITRDEISSVKSVMKDENWFKNVEGRNDDATRYWNNANSNLEKLKADPKEAKKPYVAEFDKQLKELDAQRKAKFESYTLDQKYDGKLESYYKFAAMGWEIRDTTLEPSYKGYYAFKKDFENSRPEKYKTEYVQSRISKVDNFFQVEVYKVVPELNSTADKIIKEMYEKNSRGEASYILNAKSFQKDFEKPLKTIEYNKKYLIEKTEEIDAVKAKLDKEKAMLDEYVSSGKYDANVAKYKQEIIDAVRLGKAGMANPTYDAMAKAGVKKGKVTRVVITSTTWYVAKNDYGLPLHKALAVDLAVTDENGKCWKAYGEIRKQYEGGGVYGGDYFDYWGLQDEMNCANVNK